MLEDKGEPLTHLLAGGAGMLRGLDPRERKARLILLSI